MVASARGFLFFLVEWVCSGFLPWLGGRPMTATMFHFNCIPVSQQTFIGRRQQPTSTEGKLQNLILKPSTSATCDCIPKTLYHVVASICVFHSVLPTLPNSNRVKNLNPEPCISISPKPLQRDPIFFHKPFDSWIPRQSLYITRPRSFLNFKVI